MPALSPNTQAMMQPPPTGEDAKNLFEDGFGQMAQKVLTSRYPDLVSQIVTFQVLTSDLDSGSAVGVFVLDRNGKTLHIPVVLANNQIKPVEIMFDKENGIFLPLQPGWLSEIDRSNLGVMGEGIKPPRDMVTDVDIRNLVIPPAAGRYTYASARGSKLSGFLHQAPNYVKEAFHKILTTNRKVLKFASENYDMADLTAALRPHAVKTAAVPTVHFLTPDSSTEDFKTLFGKEAGEAYRHSLKFGYAVKDDRPFFKVAMETQEAVWLHEAKEPGFYRLQRAAGTTVDVFVVPNPRGFSSKDRHSRYTGSTPLPDAYLKRVPLVSESQAVRGESRYPGPNPKYLIYTEDRDIIVTETPPVGRLIPENQVSQKLLNALQAQNTPNSGYGIFVRYEAGKISSTVPVSLSRVSTDSNGVRRMHADSIHDDPHTFGQKTIVTDPKSAVRQIVAPRDSGVVYMPPTFKFLSGSRGTADFLKTGQGTDVYAGLLKQAGACKVRLINAKGGMFGIGHATPQTKLATLQQLVINLGLRAPEARLLLEKTASKSKHEFFVVSPIQLVKFAMLCQKMGNVKLAQPPVEGDPAAQQQPPPMDPSQIDPNMGADPSMMGMDPSMMAPPPPPPPPPPDPVNIAVTEIGSQLAAQAADVARQLAEQQRDLSNQLSVLDAVQQRAQQVAAEQSGMPPLPPEAEVGAPPQAGMPPAPTMGPSPVPTMPAVGGQPGMPPPPGMGQPGMPPPPPGMGQPGMGQPGMPPGAEQPMMAEQMAQQAGPMMEGAAGLAPFGQEEASDAFEATAIGSMATNPDLRGIVSLYLPALEDSLDHLARILLTLWMQEDQYRSELGEKDFSELEERLRTVFGNLGKLVLRINQTAMAAKPDEMGTQP